MPTPLDAKTLCCDCRWWVKSETDSMVGECRRGSPVVVADAGHTMKTNWMGTPLEVQHTYCTAWPDTQWDEFCGEFRAKIEEK